MIKNRKGTKYERSMVNAMVNGQSQWSYVLYIIYILWSMVSSDSWPLSLSGDQLSISAVDVADVDDMNLGVEFEMFTFRF